MKYKEKVIYEGNLDGWVCEKAHKKFKFDKKVKNGFIEFEIKGFKTPMGEDDFKKPVPLKKHRKIHLFSLWSTATFDYTKKPYKENGQYSLVGKFGKYPSLKAELKGNNKGWKDQIYRPKEIKEDLNTYKITWLEGVVTYYFNDEIMKLRMGLKKAIFKIPGFSVLYALLGRCNRYRNPSKYAEFYSYKIGEYIEDDGSIDPDSPDDTVDDQDDNQGGEEIIIKPEDKEPLSLEETWKNLKDKSKLIALIIAVLFLMSIFFC